MLEPLRGQPVCFSKFASSIIGSGEPLPLEEDETKELDFEVELAIVIGRRGRRPGAAAGGWPAQRSQPRPAHGAHAPRGLF